MQSISKLSEPHLKPPFYGGFFGREARHPITGKAYRTFVQLHWHCKPLARAMLQCRIKNRRFASAKQICMGFARCLKVCCTEAGRFHGALQGPCSNARYLQGACRGQITRARAVSYLLPLKFSPAGRWPEARGGRSEPSFFGKGRSLHCCA